MYAITGATGHTGSAIAEKLLAKGEKVRVIGRDARRLEKFTKKGAEAAIAEMSDAAALAKAFTGAKAAYVLVPPDMTSNDYRAYQERISDAVASAIEKSGLKYAVVLSSFGANQPDKNGPVAGLYSLEKKIGRIAGVNALFLRPGYFMENFLPQLDVIKSMGMMAGPVRADLPLPLIATRDIGAAAAGALLKLDFQGKQSRELQGPADVNYQQAAKIVGRAIGRPDLIYQQAPAAMLKPAMIGMGMSANTVDLILEMAEALNTGHMKMLEPRSAQNSTPTTLETFAADTFGPAYTAAGA